MLLRPSELILQCRMLFLGLSEPIKGKLLANITDTLATWKCFSGQDSCIAHKPCSINECNPWNHGRTEDMSACLEAVGPLVAIWSRVGSEFMSPCMQSRGFCCMLGRRETL